VKKLISLIVSLGVLALLYWKIDFRSLGPVFTNCDVMWMTISLFMVVPLTLFTAWRFQKLAPDEAKLTFGECNRLILSASVLNLILPSKMGDIAKALFLPIRKSLALSLVVFEKACDMLSLLVWCVFGLVWVKLQGTSIFPDLTLFGFTLPGDWIYSTCTLGIGVALLFGCLMLMSSRFSSAFFKLGIQFAPGKIKTKLEKLSASWSEMLGYFTGSKSRFILVSGTSVFIWLLHLLQIWFFILALKAWCPFVANLALSPLGILAGLVPLTFAGVGTRDAALVGLYAPYFAAPTAAALGLLCTVRYVLPAIGGIPFFQRYLAKVRQEQVK